MATTLAMSQAETYFPDDTHRTTTRDIEKAFRDIVEQKDFPVATLNLPEHDPIPLNRELGQILYRVAQQLSNNKAIMVAPIEMELTTQEAADLLNMSRPTFIKLIETEKIPHTLVGRHRRVLLKDIEEYAKERHEAFNAAMNEIAQTEDPELTRHNPLIKR
ncbi:excisionase family DNA-binding protein [Bifidobacteriaceae bacterium NR002]|nr:excisionase family DNA-binding protein [Bifidobacteriaceae bacterium NR002]MDZ7549700.1 helix-turn-helix domain-containing protein [Bifidobacteriaceae bacterium NR047]